MMGLPTRGRVCFVAVVSILAVTAAGCKQGPVHGIVSGKVLLDGKPLPGGTLSFVSSQPGTSTIFAKIDESGNYGPVDLPLGEIQVAVDNRSLAPPPPRGNVDPTAHMKRLSPELRKMRADTVKQQTAAPQPEGVPAQSGNYVKIPDRYYQIESSNIRFSVEAGEHQRDIPLVSKP
jgi:hypothetical protein